ncbi:MAG: PP2C family protein-serine/threonine phosphatase, partial [Acidobacteria bacterium]|nr:PP2C family protein-serine/threonine phosphatase [Acidobacteriota bacterium]
HGSFSKLDRGILESLANNASSVIENARLHREAEEKRQMDEEIARAREVQQTLLPREFRGEDHFQIAGTCIPCRQLGGDYLDQFRLPDGETCVVIADVAGKGMSASLLAAALQGMLAAETSIPQPLGTMVERLNLAISRRAPEGRFVTLFCGVLHGNGDLRFVNAGHPPPLLVSGGVEPRALASGAMALGFVSAATYRETRVRLVPGDVVLMFTDGITEATGPEGEQFGEERLEDLTRSHRDGTAEEIRRAILAAVAAFCGDRPPGDDLTLLVLKYTGIPSAPPRQGSGSWSAS